MWDSDEIAKRLGEAAPHLRQELAAKLGRAMKQTDADEAEKASALSLARLFVQDACDAVRAALGKELAECPFLPSDLAQKIARDVAEVSAPFLSATDLLDDAALSALVADLPEASQAAVAGRAKVTEPLAFSISEHGAQAAVSTLMGNDGAEMSERVCATTLCRFSNNETVLAQMARRGDLPLAAIEGLVAKMSDEAAQALVRRYGLAQDLASYLGASARQHAVSETLEKAPLPKIEAHMSELRRRGCLTNDLLLSFAKRGNSPLFFAAVGVLANMPGEMVEAFLDEAGPKALSRLLTRAEASAALSDLLVSTYEDAVNVSDYARTA